MSKRMVVRRKTSGWAVCDTSTGKVCDGFYAEQVMARTVADWINGLDGDPWDDVCHADMGECREQGEEQDRAAD